jgi:hypothetical protein
MDEMLFREMFLCVPEIDYSSGYHYFLGSMENYTQAILATLKSVKSKVPILHSMYQTKEYTGLRTITQTLWRMLSNIGAADMAELSYQLETAYLNREDYEFQVLLDDYISCLYKFTVHLEELFRKLDIRGSGSNTGEQVPFGNYDFTRTRESIKLSMDFLERKII